MIKRLEELTQEEIQQIVSSGLSKRTIIAVHPYHNTDPHVLGTHNKNDNFTKFLQGNLTQKVLTIVLDTPQGKKILELESALAGKKQGLILWAQARSGIDPTPIIGWRELIKKLENLKPKRIIVGGREMHTYSRVAWSTGVRQLKSLLKESALSKDARKALGEERGYLAAVARAAKIKKQKQLLAGCAGGAAAKLIETRKFKVRTTRRLS